MRADKGHVVVDDGVRLFYESAGNGDKPLVILNGFYLFREFKYLAENRPVVALDLRSRCRSDYIADLSKLMRGIEQDVDDIEIVRRQFGLGTIDLLGHSYAGIIPILYALEYPSHVRRIVQISSMQPNQLTQYPSHLTNVDDILQTFFDRLGALQAERSALSAQEFCKKFWALLRPLYVFNPDDAEKLAHWESCHLESELNLMPYWTQALMPSIQRIDFRSEDLAKIEAPVLVVHGTKDRSSPYGGARDWAMLLPNARLLTIPNVAHVPWIEAPEKVLAPIKTFLDGTWPEMAERIESF
jgi:proline iminopeptidase